jgi:hypothetical protein
MSDPKFWKWWETTGQPTYSRFETLTGAAGWKPVDAARMAWAEASEQRAEVGTTDEPAGAARWVEVAESIGQLSPSLYSKPPTITMRRDGRYYQYMVPGLDHPTRGIGMNKDRT